MLAAIADKDLAACAMAGEIAAKVNRLCRMSIRGVNWDESLRQCGGFDDQEGPGNNGGFTPDEQKQGQVQNRQLRRLCPKTIGCDSRTTEPVRISSPDTSVRCFTPRTVCVPLLLGVDVNQPSRDVVLSVSCTRDFGWQYLAALVNVDRVFERLAILLGLEVGFRFNDLLQFRRSRVNLRFRPITTRPLDHFQ